jgi:putative PIG3 family NAD(P)H quinone oxidoreductase
MRAVVIARAGGPEVLEIHELPTPEPGPEQVRVRVRATALNRADLLQRMGLYPAPPGVRPDVPGLEFAGEVDAVGPGVTRVRPGERVFGIVGGGSYAEYVVTHEQLLVHVPDALDHAQAAAVPEAFMTAHDALVTLGGARAGANVLVHAVGSGVGLAAVQLAHALHTTVFGTARSAEKLARAAQYGLNHGCAPERFAEAIGAMTMGRGVDVVIDFVGGPYLRDNLRVLAERGRLVVVGLMGGAREEIDLALLLRKRLTVVGTVLRSRSLEEKIAVTRTFEREVVPLLARGTLRPVIDSVLPIEKVREAHERMASNANFGKIVLTL